MKKDWYAGRNGPTGRGLLSPGLPKIGELMTTELLTVPPTERVDRVVKLMLEHGVGCVPVVDERRPVGTISRADALFHRRHYGTAGKIMNTWILCLRPEADIGLAIALMAYEEVSHLLVIDGSGSLVGMVASHDLLASLARSDGYVIPPHVPSWPRRVLPPASLAESEGAGE